MESDPHIHDDHVDGSQKDKVTVEIDVPALSLGDFRLETLISEGLHGKVYSAKLNTGKIVALKMLDVSTEAESNDELFLNKVARLSTLKHDNLVKLCGFGVEEKTRILAYEFASKGSLHDMLHGKKGVHEAQPRPVLDWKQRVKIALDLAKGLTYLHEVRPLISHGDFRSNKVLLYQGLSAKIGDLNLSNRALDLTTSHMHSTPVSRNSVYHAPEFAQTGKPREESDVYSFGVVLMELITGRKPDDDDTMPQGGQPNLVTWVTQMQSEGKFEQLVDPRLKGKFPLKAVTMMVNVAVLCVDDVPQFRISMRVAAMALKKILPPPAGTYFISMFQKKVPLWMVMIIVPTVTFMYDTWRKKKKAT